MKKDLIVNLVFTLIILVVQIAFLYNLKVGVEWQAVGIFLMVFFTILLVITVDAICTRFEKTDDKIEAKFKDLEKHIDQRFTQQLLSAWWIYLDDSRKNELITKCNIQRKVDGLTYEDLLTMHKYSTHETFKKYQDESN